MNQPVMFQFNTTTGNVIFLCRKACPATAIWRSGKAAEHGQAYNGS